MSKSDRSDRSDKVDREFIIDMVGLVAGFIILIIIGILMENFDTWRTEMEQPDLQALYLFFGIPLLVPLALFGVDIAARGTITGVSTMIRYAQEQQ